MGTEIPLVEAKPGAAVPTYAFYSTRQSLDEARLAFEKVKELTLHLSAVENSAYRLASNIKKLSLIHIYGILPSGSKDKETL